MESIEPNHHSGDIISESFQKRCHMERIEDQMEFLLSAALCKCGNIADAGEWRENLLRWWRMT